VISSEAKLRRQVPFPSATHHGGQALGTRNNAALASADTDANRFVQVETVTNVPGLFCCIEKRWSTTALQNASEITASGMAATFWSAAVFCRF
jgi:hypothetical protein